MGHRVELSASHGRSVASRTRGRCTGSVASDRGPEPDGAGSGAVAYVHDLGLEFLSIYRVDAQLDAYLAKLVKGTPTVIDKAMDDKYKRYTHRRRLTPARLRVIGAFVGAIVGRVFQQGKPLTPEPETPGGCRASAATMPH